MAVELIGGNGYIGSTLVDLPDVDAVILLAGHSSVAMCDRDPQGAWVNNVEFFRSVLNRIKPGQKFIYASSASVYGEKKGMYDVTKRTIDELAQISDVEYYGLRFATVCGWSPMLRIDLMINRMVTDAKNTGGVYVSNASLNRPILGINDLGRAIKAILSCKEDKRGIYNLASFNDTVNEMAMAVAAKYDALINYLPDSPHYVFSVDTKPFEKAFDFEFTDTLNSVMLSLEKPVEGVCVRN